MVSLTLIYDAPLPNVAKLWNDSAQDLGLQTLRPIRPEFDHSWEIFKLAEFAMFVGIRQVGSTVWLELHSSEPAYRPYQKLMDSALALPLAPLEASLVGGEAECSELSLCLYFSDTPLNQLFDSLGDTPQLRALRKDAAGPTGPWEAEAQGRGFGFRETEKFLHLDVRWNPH